MTEVFSMRAALSSIRERYHPLFYRRMNPVARRAIVLLDRPVWLRIPGVSFQVRGRLITHGAAFAIAGFQEPAAQALSLACVRTLDLQSFWDVGANIGFYTWLPLSSKPALRGVLFEALPSNCDLISKTMVHTHLNSSIELIHKGASDHLGIAVLQADEIAGATSSLEPSKDTFEARHWKVCPRSVEVPITSIDEARKTRDRIDFLKIDVQVASKLAARRRGHGGVSLEMGRKRSGAGFQRGRSDGTGRFRGPASAKAKKTPRLLVLWAALDYWHPYPRWENGNSG